MRSRDLRQPHVAVAELGARRVDVRLQPRRAAGRPARSPAPAPPAPPRRAPPAPAPGRSRCGASRSRSVFSVRWRRSISVTRTWCSSSRGGQLGAAPGLGRLQLGDPPRLLLGDVALPALLGGERPPPRGGAASPGSRCGGRAPSARSAPRRTGAPTPAGPPARRARPRSPSRAPCGAWPPRSDSRSPACACSSVQAPLQRLDLARCAPSMRASSACRAPSAEAIA